MMAHVVWHTLAQIYSPASFGLIAVVTSKPPLVSLI